MDVYDRLGITKIVNAQGNVTRIGGSIMAPAVLESMAEASRHFVSIEELNEKIGQRIAGLIETQAAMVCSGAAGGLLLAAAACMAGSDEEKIKQLPDTTGMRDEFVVQALHRSEYNQSVRVAGGTLVEVGGPQGATEEEIAGSLGPDTAAFLYNILPIARVWQRGVSLERVVAIAHERGVPVIVDASAILPPLSNLVDVPATGADLVTFSGGKGLEGPQGTGILCGSAGLIRAAMMNSNPNQSVGRAMKVAKEEMVGLLTAVERYFTRDHESDRKRWRAMCEHIASAVETIGGLTAEVIFWEARGIPAVRFAVDEDELGLSKEDLLDRLRAGDPPVYLWGYAGEFCMAPSTLKDGEDEVVAQALRRAASPA